MDPNLKLSIDIGDPLTDLAQYMRLLGILIYLAISWPDIAFVLNKLSQFVSQPKTAHLDVLLHLLKYLKASYGQGILFPATSSLSLIAYADADWENYLDTCKSTSSYCINIGDSVVSWKSKNQTTVSRYSAEDEYRALTIVTSEITWLSNLLLGFGATVGPTKVLCDNQVTIHIASNPTFHEITKHVDIECHLVERKFFFTHFTTTSHCHHHHRLPSSSPSAVIVITAAAVTSDHHSHYRCRRPLPPSTAVADSYHRHSRGYHHPRTACTRYRQPPLLLPGPLQPPPPLPPCLLKGMEVASDFRSWDELIPDTLGVIFTNLSLQERLTVIPTVCKSWAKAVTGPYCWQEIDIEEWSNHCEPDQLDRMLEMLITRSSGSLRKLSVSGLQTERIFAFIAENAGSLQTLRLPRSNMSDYIVEQITRRLSMISFLDVSYCIKIGACALEIIGKNCKLLEGLCRNMHPLDTAGKPFQDDEAYAIASTMPKLKHLELAYHLISTAGVLQIFSNCRLEFLDLRGCWGVKLDNMLVKQNYPKLKVLGPLVPDCYERDDWEDCSDISDSSEYLAWEFVAGDMDEYYEDESDSSGGMWDDEGRLEELEFRFYQGIEDAGMYWPPSP